eukprot:Seg8692.1 transcript_id=Seg8692.1/GoldUCD/mRNA.D3Y31 product="hypothetical protein" protein_id=Seg8692.1/GoldUCD/D3Y31
MAGVAISRVNPVLSATVSTASNIAKYLYKKLSNLVGAQEEGASATVSTASNIAKYLYKKLSNLVGAQEERAIKDFMKSIKFAYYDEVSIYKSISGIAMNQYEEFVTSFGKRHHFPDYVTEAILEAKYGTEHEELLKNFRFVVGETNNAVDLHYVTHRNSDPDGSMDFACVMIKFQFRLPTEEVTSGGARESLLGMLKLFDLPEGRIKSFGQNIGALHFKERDLTVEEQDCIINYFRLKAKKALMHGNTDEE